MFALVGSWIGIWFNPDISPHRIERAPLIFCQPGLEIALQCTHVTRTVSHERRHQLHGVGTRHRGFDHVEDVVDATRDGKGSLHPTR